MDIPGVTRNIKKQRLTEEIKLHALEITVSTSFLNTNVCTPPLNKEMSHYLNQEEYKLVDSVPKNSEVCGSAEHAFNEMNIEDENINVPL